MVCFPGSSTGNESSCNAVDPGSIPGSGRSPAEGIGYPLHYSWASPVAQMVKNLPTMWETWVQSLSPEDPQERGMATHSSILARRISKSWTWLSNWAHTHTQLQRGTGLMLHLQGNPSYDICARILAESLVNRARVSRTRGLNLSFRD